MLNDYENGGLKILDIQSFNCALKAKWLQKYLDITTTGNGSCFSITFLHNITVK